ncbi:MAG: phosphatase PAP2 family protein [Bacteroidota bacterium]|jgi:membrane-associated phospholipid phosphatase
MIPQAISKTKVMNVELRTVDIFALAYIILLSLLEVLFRSNISGWQNLLFENGFILIGLVVLVSVLQRIQSSTVRSTSRITLYMMLTSIIYHQMGTIIHLVFPFWWDGEINTVEKALFHGYPTVLLQWTARPWLTEFMMFGYVVYVALLPAVAFFIWIRGNQHELEQYLTEFVLTNLLCYLFYFLVPVAGPSRALAAMYTTPLHGHFFTSVTEYMAANVHLPGGAFPSAHCASTIVMLAALYRCSRPVGYGFVAMAFLIFASTVYGRFHYITDVIGGISLAILSLWMIPKLQAILDRLNFRLEYLVTPRVRPDVIGDGRMPEEAL